jgi:pimeloyl-ACP methyl ester carboxylesterase
MSCLEWRAPDAATMLFVHATGFNAETYRALLAPLALQFHVFACDLRGHGFSTLPTRPGLAEGWTIFRDDIVMLLGQLTAGPVIVAGHSLGATVGLMAAAADPSRVRALILVEPVLAPSAGMDDRKPSTGLALRAAQRRSIFPSPKAALDSYRGRGIFASWPDSAIGDYLAGGLIEAGDDTWRLACAPAWEAEIFHEAPGGIAQAARDIACPMSILHGSIASTSTASELALIRRLKPDARVVTLEGGTHFLPIEQPGRVAAQMLSALKGL